MYLMKWNVFKLLYIASRFELLMCLKPVYNQSFVAAEQFNHSQKIIYGNEQCHVSRGHQATVKPWRSTEAQNLRETFDW